jgi:hypothetical protein
MSRAARCVACHGVRSHAVPVALVGECSIPLVWNVACQRSCPMSAYESSHMRLEAMRKYSAKNY